MAGLTKAQIEAKLAAVEAENARLREQLDDSAQSLAEAVESGTSQQGTVKRLRGRAFFGMTMVVLATLLVPATIVVGFAARQASDTNRFVGTLAPLSENPAIQALIVERATVAIDDALGIDDLVNELLDNALDPQATPRLAAAGDRLAPLLADQARSGIRSALTVVVESDVFAAVWRRALTVAHRQFVSVMEANPDGAVAIDENGSVVIQVGPIIDELKPALIDAGFTIADSIPEIDATITLAELRATAQARLGYSVVTTSADFLPWIALTLLIVGILVYPRRPRAVFVAGTILLVTGATLGGAIAIGESVAATALSTQAPTDATRAIYLSLTSETQAVMLAFVTLGVVMIIAAVLAGPSATAEKGRSSAIAQLTRAAAALDARGLRPQRLRATLARLPWILWVLLGSILVLLVATMRPLTPGDIAVGVLVLGVAAALYGILAVPTAPADTAGVMGGDSLERDADTIAHA